MFTVSYVGPMWDIKDKKKIKIILFLDDTGFCLKGAANIYVVIFALNDRRC